MIEEGEVESEVVTDEHRPADEFEERRHDLVDAGRFGNHRVADAGERGDERRNPLAGSNQGLEGAEQLPTPISGGGHLGQRCGVPVHPRSSRHPPPRR